VKKFDLPLLQSNGRRYAMSLTLFLLCLAMFGSLVSRNSAGAQTGTTTGSYADGAASVLNPLTGTWVGPFDTLANGESNRIFLKLRVTSTGRI
jgi:hypothetical protein